MTYHIITYGCQMNESDSERIATLLEGKGYKHSAKPAGADLVVINVCSVRQKPIDKIKNQISRLRTSTSLGTMARQAKIVLTGCILPEDKQMFKKLGAEIKNFEEIENIPPTAAFVPITRGCNNFCAYCAVPYTKGRERHRSVKKIISEVEQLIKKGHKKIMLLGQNVNSYPDFVGLLKKATALKGNFKIEFLTNHPKDFSDELIKEMANNPKIARYIHLPYQAGDNEILKQMNRKYTRQEYLKLVNKIKKSIPNITITTDVIVGFPGETKKQFQHTLDVAKKVGFSQIYIGKFSPRPGTPAALLPDNVPLEEKKRREQALRKLIKPNKKKKKPKLHYTPLLWNSKVLCKEKKNNKRNNKKMVVILGPTAAGKTGLSIKLAKKYNGEVVSADSRQVYKGMDIGTGKITKKQMQGIPHHLLDVVSPKAKFSVAQYQKKAIAAINKISKKGKVPFLVGGSPFYIFSVIEGWQFPKMKANPLLRKQLEKKSLAELQIMLKNLSSERYETIELKNKRRLVRAIEIAKTLGEVPNLKKNPLFDCLLLGIMPAKEKIEKRINARVDKMIRQGLDIEVKNLVKKYGFNSVLKETIGYSEWQSVAYLADRPNTLQKEKKEIAEKIKQNSLKLAKRQMTWFKRDKKILWIENQGQAEKLIKEFLNQ